MSNRAKCVICGTATNDIINLGEMKTCENITAHYYCLLLASTIKQSGEDEEGILGFLPSDIQNEVKQSQKRYCVYCQRKGASVKCNAKNCKVQFHLPCGIKRDSGHQFTGKFLSYCCAHRFKQKFKIPSDPQSCPICYEIINFKNVSETLWAPCCKKQSFFHKTCIQQMALSAGYFFKCPMCNNSKVFQTTMKRYGVFIPDRDASWELEPHAFEELLYRHEECNAKVCLCKSGRTYNSLGPWNIVLCSMCGSQGTHINCSKLNKKDGWICESCIIEKKTDVVTNPPLQTNEIEIIRLPQPSTSSQSTPLELPQIPNKPETELVLINSQSTGTEQTSQRNKRKRNRSFRTSTIVKKPIDLKNYKNDPTLIEIDSEDSDDVVVIDDEPSTKCLIAQDRSLLKLRNTPREQKQFNTNRIVKIEQHDNSSCTNFMNLIISDVRSISEPGDDYIENNIPKTNPVNLIDVSSEEFKKIHNKVLFPLGDQQQLQQQQQCFVLQEVVYNNNTSSIYQDSSSNQNMGNSNTNSADDIVIID